MRVYHIIRLDYLLIKLGIIGVFVYTQPTGIWLFMSYILFMLFSALYPSYKVISSDEIEVLDIFQTKEEK